jgi:hypothetical protein
VTVRSSSAAPGIQTGTGKRGRLAQRSFWLPAILIAVLAALFYQSFQPGEILFANDITFGQMKVPANHLPEAFTGSWRMNWLGTEGVAAAPTISALLTMLLSPEIFLKIYAPFSLLFVGFCAWLFFRQLQFNPWVCASGGLAAGLNMHFFSNACWGLGDWNIATGMIFLALAALHAKSLPFWARGVLAGLAVGMNLMEGLDIGAIQCVFFGFYILWQILTNETTWPRKIATAFGTEALVVFFAGFIAAHSISSLVSTQVEGVVGTGQDTQTKQEHWDFATRWSLPKLETLRLISPGLFGYRMSSRITVPDKSSAYWGMVGRDTRIADIIGDDPQRQTKAFDALGLVQQMRNDLQNSDPLVRDNAIRALLGKYTSAARYSGSGEYAGMLVSLLAIFALVNACRGAKTPYSFGERRNVWFWGGAALIGLLAAWGRYGFFYRLLYQLPYFSTIRNPIKFLQPFHVAWLILAAYGLEALWRRYLQPVAPAAGTSGITGFEKKWIITTASVAAATLVAVLVFKFNRRPYLVEYLLEQGINPQRAGPVADFAIGEAEWFFFWLLISVGMLALVLNRAFSGRGAKTAWIIFGGIIILDLARSDIPWIHYFNYEKEYAPNSIVEFLSDKPYEHRVMGRVVPKGIGSSISTRMGQLYDYWQQNDFPYHGIQTLDFPQWPRTPELDANFMKNFGLKGTSLSTSDLWPAERLWELTSTRYILYSTELAAVVNEHADAQHQLNIKTLLTVKPKADVTFLEDAGELTAVPDNHGQYALIEVTNTLPRVKLFANWQPQTDDSNTLRTLTSHDFDPHHTVLIAPNTPLDQPPGDAQLDPGMVGIDVFKSKYVKLHAEAKTPAVLLLTDRVAPNWQARIDHKPAPILRCNYLMRGVFLTPGNHIVEFRYKPPLTTLGLSLCAWGVGIITAGYLIWFRTPESKVAAAQAAPVPQPPSPSPAVPEPVKQKGNGSPAPVTAAAGSRRRRDGKQTKRR